MINKSKQSIIIALILVSLGVFGALALVKRNQEIRRSATADKTTIKLSNTAITGAVDSDVSVGIMIETPRKVSSAEVKLCYGDALTTDENSITSVGPLENMVYKKVENNCVVIAKRVETSVSLDSLPTDSFQFANINFKIKKNGNLNIDKENSLIGGQPVSEGGDFNVVIDEVQNATVLVSGGAVDNSSISFESSDFTNKNKNENLTVKMYLNTPKNFDSARAKFCYGDKLQLEDNKITRGTEFTDIAKKEIGDNCVDYAVLASGKVLTGKVLLGTFDFKAINSGSGKLQFDSNIVTYSNVSETIKIGNIMSADYTIGEAVVTCDPNNGSCGTLNYKISFMGVADNVDTKCVDWPLKMVIVNKVGETKEYTVNSLTKEGTKKVKVDNEEREFTVYKGTVNLPNLSSKDNLAIYIKGPKHIQVKYGKNNQNSYYGKDGGEINLNDRNAVYDFSAYPILAGDINKDGVINGLDYSEIKTQLKDNLGKEVPGVDLDGNCIINSGDSAVFKLSLVEKQEQLY